MDRKTAEGRIRDLVVEIGRISKEYGTKDYLTMVVFTKSGCIGFNNRHSEGGEDEDTPLDYYEFGIDFDRAEGGDEFGVLAPPLAVGTFVYGSEED